MSQPDTHPLRPLMQAVGFSTYKALSQAAGVSEKQIRRLRQGTIAPTRVETLLKLSQALQISLTELVAVLQGGNRHPSAPSSDTSRQLEDLRREYDRLQEKLVQQQTELRQEFQQSSLHILEPLLLQLPTAAYAAQQNPQAPAVKLLPLLKPIDRLVQEWGIEAIAQVGSEIPYDPQQHQLMDGQAEVGDPVRVRYTGYRWGDRLLYRAKVSPLKN